MIVGSLYINVQVLTWCRQAFIFQRSYEMDQRSYKASTNDDVKRIVGGPLQKKVPANTSAKSTFPKSALLQTNN